jgi:hypothetical protein
VPDAETAAILDVLTAPKPAAAPAPSEAAAAKP